jgi:carbamoyltransferase
MIIWGVTALSHDAAISIIKNGKIVFAAHSERYSRVKNDFYLNQQIVDEALTFGSPNEIVWYEKPYLKKTRQAYAGQWSEVFGDNTIPKNHLKKFFKQKGLRGIEIPKIRYASHHESHAAAGAYTSKFDHALVIVLDAIGEWNTCTTWEYNRNNNSPTLTKLQTTNYPHSFGLLYSAFTQRCGLKPNEEEYILMGMAAYGQPKYVQQIKDELIESMYPLRLKVNPHIGILEFLNDADPIDLAASIQEIANEFIVGYVSQAVVDTGITKVIYQGGVALNCVTNTKLLEVCNEVWIMPNPGDAGNSLGAACLHYGKPVEWESPYLGTNIEGEYPVDKIIQELLQNKICGVANGRAEFGPRALGNRSLLADPRGAEIKDKVNEIKRRQKFRPFAPAILEEHLHTYFNINRDTVPYMQYVAEAKPETVEKFPAIVHFDNTARVQTVGKDDNTGFRKLLEAWYKETGCPILLNTSLNIRGEPLVNNKNDAIGFNNKYNIKVFTD